MLSKRLLMLSQRILRIVISTIDDQQNTPDSPDKHHKCSAKDYVLCNSIIEYQQQRWAASQPRGFRFLIQHHLLLAGLFDCLPILKASLSLSLPPCVPRTRKATTLVCVCLAVTNACKHHAILGCVCLAVAYVNECHAAERQPFGQPRPKIQNQAWPSRCFSSYYFLSRTELFFSFGGNPFFGPGLAGCSLILILRRLLSFLFVP